MHFHVYRFSRKFSEDFQKIFSSKKNIFLGESFQKIFQPWSRQSARRDLGVACFTYSSLTYDAVDARSVDFGQSRPRGSRPSAGGSRPSARGPDQAQRQRPGEGVPINMRSVCFYTCIKQTCWGAAIVSVRRLPGQAPL